MFSLVLTVNITVLWYIMLCGLVSCCQHLTASWYYTCDGGSTFLWKTNDKLPDYMVSSQK